ncbi:MAG: UDP-2,4-diacetamido-2,4,6-trideoxy-beta-L-altropyranose hydrolase [Ruminococcus flavefaciens]|nr:UDP-2,4-diacetamido-2,4,6-trideoxy-beta-L-altropyranose hydrolase [Ruminococcus flavefaciens]
MRCLSIARGVRQDSSMDGVLFLTADSSFSDIIHLSGITNHILHGNYRNLMLELDQMQDLIKHYHPMALFIDSYYVTDIYLEILWETCKSTGTLLIYLDDLLAFAYPCDILINYSIYGADKLTDYKELYNHEGRRTPRFLLGLAYTPLREEFQELPIRIVREQAANILVSTGGSDSYHITLQLLKEIIRQKMSYTFHVVVGKKNLDINEIKLLVSRTDSSNIILYQNVTEMAKLMQSCDLAISAAGSTLYELCATQTPTITYAFADNQITNAEKFKENGIMKYVGDFRYDGLGLLDSIVDTINTLMCDTGTRALMAEKMKNIVDGKGVVRIWENIYRF